MIGIVVSQFNSSITDKLLMGAEAGLKVLKVPYDVVKVPGAFEIPLTALRMARSKCYEGLIVLGVIIKGETHHYQQICRATVDGVLSVMLDEAIPIAFEILMVDDSRLAHDRASSVLEKNKGYSAAHVVVQMVKTLKSLPDAT